MAKASWIFNTNIDDTVPLYLRVTLGVILFPHGAQKLVGWFGGFGFDGTIGFFTDTIGLPWIIGFLVILIEFFGALALIMGFTTRIMALGTLAIMLGAIWTSHLEFGFFMNWSGNQPGEGYEYHLLVIAIALIMRGGGKWAIDSLFVNRNKNIQSARLATA